LDGRRNLRLDFSKGWGGTAGKWAILAAFFCGFAVLVKVRDAFLVIGAAVSCGAGYLRTKFLEIRTSRTGWLGLMAAPAFGYYVLDIPAFHGILFFLDRGMIKLSPVCDFYADWLGFVGGLVGLTVLFVSLVGVLFAAARDPLGSDWSVAWLFVIWADASVPDVHPQLLSHPAEFQ